MVSISVVSFCIFAAIAAKNSVSLFVHFSHESKRITPVWGDNSLLKDAEKIVSLRKSSIVLSFFLDLLEVVLLYLLFYLAPSFFVSAITSVATVSFVIEWLAIVAVRGYITSEIRRAAIAHFSVRFGPLLPTMPPLPVRFA